MTYHRDLSQRPRRRAYPAPCYVGLDEPLTPTADAWLEAMQAFEASAFALGAALTPLVDAVALASKQIEEWLPRFLERYGLRMAPPPLEPLDLVLVRPRARRAPVGLPEGQG